MHTNQSILSRLVITLCFALASLSTRVRADEAPSSQPWFASTSLGYGYAFSTEGDGDDASSSNGRALLWSAALGWRSRDWFAVHAGAWGSWVPTAIVKYDEWEREHGVLRMQAVGPGMTFMAPWGGYVSADAGVAWERGTYLERHQPFGCGLKSELGYRAQVGEHLQLGLGLQAGAFVGELGAALWTAGQGGLVLTAAVP